ncbi:MAG: hypothetical protein BM564_05890 [Bacteroidetes bacterium MedPE-SWsnd-G2]|nr:MAG: hypothetical protein BM564_05890 [Bacteroidetes bacterium MedPE-SWsnd-G2]
MKQLLLLCLAVTFTTVACKENKKTKCPNGVSATVKDMKGLDGCSWIFELEDGTNVQPFNLDEFEFHFEDLQKIVVSYTEDKGMAGICMMGPMVRVSCIDKQ